MSTQPTPTPPRKLPEGAQDFQISQSTPRKLPEGAQDFQISQATLRTRYLGGVSQEALRRRLKNGTLPDPDYNLSSKHRWWWASTLYASGINVFGA